MFRSSLIQEVINQQVGLEEHIKHTEQMQYPLSLGPGHHQTWECLRTAIFDVFDSYIRRLGLGMPMPTKFVKSIKHRGGYPMS